MRGLWLHGANTCGFCLSCLKMKPGYVIWFILFLLACRKPNREAVNPDGVRTALPHLWKTSLSNDGQLIEVVTEAHIWYRDEGRTYALVGANRSGRRYLVSLDIATGKIQWEWSDLLPMTNNPTAGLDPLSFKELEYYRAGNLLIFIYVGNTYCLDLLSGKTVWKRTQLIQRFQRISGLNNLFFTPGVPYHVREPYQVYAADIDGVLAEKPIVKPAYDTTGAMKNSGFYGFIRDVVPVALDTDTLLAIPFIDPALAGFTYRSALGLYNFSKKKWVYQRQELNPADSHTNVVWTRVYQNKLYHTSGRSLQCNDLLTGELIWRQHFSQGFAMSGFIIEDDRLIANCEDTYVYALDPATGRQLWKEKGSGTSSPMSYLNGVVYFLGGGDGRLHALDATTGRHMWLVDSPDRKLNRGAWFYGVCTAVPAGSGQKGTVVAMTGLSAYAYQAAR